MENTPTIIEQLEYLEKLIPVINKDRRYWFVRTEGGDYYDHFINGSYIAIGYNEVTLSEIKLGENSDPFGMDILTEIIKDKRPNETRPGLTSSQLVRFVYQIKKGDIVFIPSSSSEYFYFGEVQSTIVDIANSNDGCPHLKRKKVSWIKQFSRQKVDSDLTKIIYTHQTISDVQQYDWIIDRLLNDFFIKGNETHLVLNVRQREKISADVFFSFGDIFKLANEFCLENNIPIVNNTQIKTKVQSEGVLECISQGDVIKGALEILALGLILVALAGGKFSLKIKNNEKQGFSLDAESGVPTGIIERISKFLNDRADRKVRAKLVDKALEKMEIKDPKDLVKLIEKSENKN